MTENSSSTDTAPPVTLDTSSTRDFHVHAKLRRVVDTKWGSRVLAPVWFIRQHDDYDDVPALEELVDGNLDDEGHRAAEHAYREELLTAIEAAELVAQLAADENFCEVTIHHHPDLRFSADNPPIPVGLSDYASVCDHYLGLYRKDPRFAVSIRFYDGELVDPAQIDTDSPEGEPNRAPKGRMRSLAEGDDDAWDETESGTFLDALLEDLCAEELLHELDALREEELTAELMSQQPVGSRCFQMRGKTPGPVWTGEAWARDCRVEFVGVPHYVGPQIATGNDEAFFRAAAKELLCLADLHALLDIAARNGCYDLEIRKVRHVCEMWPRSEDETRGPIRRLIDRGRMTPFGVRYVVTEGPDATRESCPGTDASDEAM
jgi:hypothetical protein